MSGERSIWRHWLARIGVPVAGVGLLFALAGYRYAPVAADYFFDDESCVGCHKENNSAIVAQWLGSAHFGADVSCTDCHGLDHDAMFAADGEVSSKICAECHEAEYQEFGRSSHALADVKARENPRFLAAPSAIQRQGCLTCHSIGKEFPDGGVGQCNYCHSGHRFSLKEAREPRACEGCHMGPDHPQYEAYTASKHGTAYNTLKDESTAPTCVTCHVGGATGHDNTDAMTLGRASHGGVLEGDSAPIPMKVFTRAAFEAGRERMVEICRKCHSAKFAKGHLADADEIKKIADRIVGEAAQIIRELHDEGALAPMPADRPPHPTAGHALVLGGGQLYSDTSAIEQRFFEMAKFHHSITFKGAYHFSPDYTHWLGYAALQGDLTFIRAEAARLRAEAKARGSKTAGRTPDREAGTLARSAEALPWSPPSLAGRR